MELLDVVDENNNKTGEIIDREIVHEKGLWHREVAVIVINQNNEILLEKRSAIKKKSPNKWALCAGHIEAGDEPENAVVREVKEEIGIDLKFEELEFLTVAKRKVEFTTNQHNNAFMYIYLYKTNKKISDYIIQKEELSEVKYFDLKELEEEIKKQNTEFAFSKEDYIIDVINLLKNIIKN